MCVIVYKPQSLKLPSTATLKRCFINNPDGAGIMYRVNGKVHIEKGFMDFPSFKNALNKLKKEIDVVKSDIVFHFRIATHGDVIPGICHPFPVTSDTDLLFETSLDTFMGVAHNGVIGFCDYDLIMSDTQVFIRDCLYYLKNRIKDKAVQELITQGTRSRFAIMTKSNVYLLGDWVKENGVYYSNTSYMSYKDLWDIYMEDIYEDVPTTRPRSYYINSKEIIPSDES